jgi:iron complex outermembrane recepter protein
MKSWKPRGAVAFLMSVPFAIQAQTAPKPATPPPAPPTDNEISEEIVVTAQKRATALQDVPFSVAAVTNENIKESGATNLVEVARNVPGLYIADLGPGQSQVAIRGISAGQVVRDQPGVKESVGIYLDESPISVALFTPDLNLYDLDRIEVLRGPQGTLFGAGSSSGTVRYITAQPKIGAFGGSAEIGFNGVTDGDWGGNLRGALNVPLGESSAMRVVGYYDDMPGFIDSVYPDRSTRKDVNGGSRTGGRLAFRFEPNENLTITPRIVYQKLETDGFPRIDIYNILGNPYTTTETPVDPGKRGQVTQLDEGLSDQFTMGDLKLDFSFGDDIGLTSVSTYIDRKVHVLRDASQLTGSVTKSFQGTDAQARLASPLHDDTDLQVFSQEIRIASTGEGPFQWLAGAFYQNADRKYGQTLPTPGYDAITLELIGHDSAYYHSPPDTPYYSRLSYNFDQFAVFGEATYRFNPQWALTGGLRYYDFSEDRLLTFAGAFADQGYTDEAGSVSSNGFSPRVILAFSPNRNVQFTAQASRGFRLGGINDPLNVGLCTPEDLVTYSGHPTWDDEKAKNYEIGAKTRLADGRVTFNSAVFFTQVDGLQVIADAGSCSSRIVLNAQAETLGAEMELFLHPDEHWDFGVSATYSDAQITQTQADSTGAPIGGIRDGNRLPTSPKLQAAASGGYTWGLGESLESNVRLTAQYVGDSYTQLADQEPGFGVITNSPTPPPGAAALIDMGNVDGIPGGGIDPLTINFNPLLPSYDIFNLRWGISSDRWESALYVNNLFDERAYLSVDRERGRRARVGFLTNPPRTYGVSFRMNF